ncbi:MAG: hypothetical protein COA50_06760 [Flavobacteriaceae bacterium]|nr:MAG: hypothetical protein COA50_06760 [Flavobacteriaceae bacterium]
MRKIKAIIFDFDGTLVDSENIHYQSWNTVLISFHYELSSRDYFENLAGVPTLGNASYVKVKYALKQNITTLVDLKEQATTKIMATERVRFMPYAKELLDFLYQKNIPMSIVTGSSRKELDPFLTSENIRHYFKHTITRDDVNLSKPNPEGYLKCAQLMGFKKTDYLVLEDTQGGIAAAKAANLTCFGIQSDTSLHHKLQGADTIFANLEEAFLHFKPIVL